ncbi:MAG: sigma-70 family RNA polymerase sigma factor [Verrucomicrobiota bacterium]
MSVPASPTSQSVFPSTRWTLISQMQDGAPTAQHQAALATICGTYWYPLYVFARRFGKNEDEARDVVQDCFAHLIEGDHLKSADPLRGRLRTFLLTVMRNIMQHQDQRKQAQKRGGGASTLSLDLRDAEGRYLNDPPAPGATPEQAYERKWALTLLETTRLKLRLSYLEAGKVELFDHLSPALAEGERWTGHPQAAASLGIDVGTVRVSLHRMRKRYRDLLLEQVAATVSSDGDVRAELAYLMGLFA